MDWKYTRTPTREHAHTHFFRGSIVYLQHHSGHAGCWKLPLCDDVSEGEEKKRNCYFHSRDKGDREGRVAAGVGATGKKD